MEKVILFGFSFSPVLQGSLGEGWGLGLYDNLYNFQIVGKQIYVRLLLREITVYSVTLLLL
jgi:hypothetical protein